MLHRSLFPKKDRDLMLQSTPQTNNRTNALLEDPFDEPW
jgi:hypothetical protein